MVLTFDLITALRAARKQALPPHLINPNFSDSDFKKWALFALEFKKFQLATPGYGRYSDLAFIDRSGMVPSIMSVDLSRPGHALPKFDKKYSTVSLLDLCLARAKHILDQNKTVNLLWSGGLDSTLMLFSFLNQCKNTDQLNIVCNFKSIIESGSMFDRYIKNSNIRIKFDQTSVNPEHSYTYDQEDQTQLYVSGGCGDQLYMGGDLFINPERHDITRHWDSGIYSENFLEIVRPTISQSPRPLQSLRDFKWWFLFNFYWISVSYDDQKMRSPGVAQRSMAFYNTEDFQQWSAMTNTYHENIHEYRWPSKHALLSLINCEYYINHKRKVNSNNWNVDSNWYILDQQFNNYYYDRQEKISYKSLVHNY